MIELSDGVIARIAHEANRAFRDSLGEPDTGPWEALSEEKRASVTAGVAAHRDRVISPEESHEMWRRYNHGHINDVPYAELTDNQRQKDDLFIGVVRALTGQAEVPGYTKLNSQQIESIEGIRKMGETLAVLIDDMRGIIDPRDVGHPEPRKLYDQRWVSIGQTHFQQGLMALVRAVTQPEFF